MIDSKIRLGLLFSLLVQTDLALAASEKASYDFVFCYDEKQDFLSRGFKYEGCLQGSREITRQQWLDSKLAAKQLSQKEYQYYKNKTPAKMDASLDSQSYGTAFMVNNDGFMITSNHVVAKCKAVVLISKVDLYPTQVIATSKEEDIAILSTAYIPKGIVQIRKAPLVLGEPIYAFGFPLITKLRTLNMTSGMVSGEHALGSPSLVQLSTPIQPGNSGGPIIDDYGRVAGVVAAKLTEGQNIGFGLQGKILRDFLDKHNIAYGLSSNHTKVATKDLATAAKTFTRPLLCLVDK